MQFVADRDRVAVDRDGGCVAVDVIPFEAEEFAASHPGVGCEPERREQAVACCGMQERLELLGCPGLLLDLGDGAQFGGVGDERDVARHDPPFDGVVEGTADDEMDLQHRLRSERPGPVGGVELVLVEGFEMMQAEPAGSGPCRGWGGCAG